MAVLGSPAIVVSNGFQKGIDEVVSSNQLSIESLEHKGVDVLGIIVNRVDPLCREVLKKTLKQAIYRSDCRYFAAPFGLRHHPAGKKGRCLSENPGIGLKSFRGKDHTAGE